MSLTAREAREAIQKARGGVFAWVVLESYCGEGAYIRVKPSAALDVLAFMPDDAETLVRRGEAPGTVYIN